ncbi:MAG: hypothetical protein KF865_12205 [Bdellovibrionaceae bacterium]|nr:hypothetical protein [Pseudobdellovibrionaceae bacterium]
MRRFFPLLICLSIVVPARAEVPGLESRLQQDANSLNRRLQPWQMRARNIQHRLDELYGLENPTFLLHQSADFSLSLSPSVSYRQKAASPFSVRTAVENDLSKQRYFDQPSFAGRIPPRIQELEWGAESVLQTEWSNRPFLRVTAIRIEARKRLTDPNLDRETSFRGDYSNQEIAAGNEVALSPEMSLRTELVRGVRRDRFFDPDEVRPGADQKIEDWSFNPDFTWKKTWGVFHILPNLGVTRRLDDSPGVTTGNHQTLGFQWDMTARDEDPVARIYELGVHRVENLAPAQPSAITVQPYVSGHWKGLARGKMDASAGYQILLQRQPDDSLRNSQQITLVPKYLPFSARSWENWREVAISAPMRATWGALSDHHLNLGLGFEGTWDSHGVRLKPTATLEYDHGDQSRGDDWGFHVGVGF